MINNAGARSVELCALATYLPLIDGRRRELSLNLRVCLPSVHRVGGLCVVNAWMMICQGGRTRFLVYDDE